MTDFVYDTVLLPFPKTDLTALPGGADPTQYLTADQWNALCQAVVDLKSAVRGGKFYELATNADATPADGSTARIRFDGTSILVSINGGAWVGLRGADGAPGADGGGGGGGQPALWFDIVDRITDQLTYYFPGSPPSFIRTSGDISTGFIFRALRPMTVLVARAYVLIGGSPKTFKFSLWQPATGTRLGFATSASIVVDGSIASVTFPTPIVLTRGSAYTIGVWEVGGGGYTEVSGLPLENQFPLTGSLWGPALQLMTAGPFNYGGHDACPGNFAGSVWPIAPIIADL